MLLVFILFEQNFNSSCISFVITPQPVDNTKYFILKSFAEKLVFLTPQKGLTDLKSDKVHRKRFIL